MESPKTERIRSRDLWDVPQWEIEPYSLISEPLLPGGRLRVSVRETGVHVSLPDEALQYRKHLDSRAEPGKFFDGAFPCVTHIDMEEVGQLNVMTGITGNFDYIAAAYAFREHERDNPIRPLAAQAVLVSPDNSGLIFEHRLHSLDHANTRNAFGGALKPGETDIIAAMIGRMSSKWKRAGESYVLDLSPQQFIPTGMCRDNITNVYCATHVLTLTDSQYARARAFAEAAAAQESEHGRERLVYEIPIAGIMDKLRQFVRWEPITFANTLYALSAMGVASPDEVHSLTGESRRYYQQVRRRYSYPMERYIDTSS